jgi:hypothetical protein
MLPGDFTALSGCQPHVMVRYVVVTCFKCEAHTCYVSVCRSSGSWCNHIDSNHRRSRDRLSSSSSTQL